MSYIRRFYHFLGGVIFAVILITLVAAFVVAGTFIESWTDSHRYAALFTYRHPVFIGMLWLFFVNIFLSTTRRWPFRMRHIPFLITHLGLLMILAGAIVKSSYGTQGSMGILEGSGKGEIFLEDSYVVHVEDYQKQHSHSFSIKKDIWGRFNPDLSDSHSSFPNLNILLAEYLPNTVEKYEYWIKGDKICIEGLPPFPVYEANSNEEKPLPVSFQGSWQGPSGPDWNIMAIRGESVEDLLKRAFIQDTELRISRSDTEELLIQLPLKEALRKAVEFGAGDCSFQLELSYSPVKGIEGASLRAGMSGEEILIPLNGEGSLINYWVSRPYLGTPPFVIDLVRMPTLLFIEDDQGENYLFSISKYGEIEGQDFRVDRPKTLIVYDGGHGGYGFQTELDLSIAIAGRKERRAAGLYNFSRQFREVAEASPSLAQPLEVFRRACEKQGEDFVEMLTSLLQEWDKRRSWLYPKRISLPDELMRVFDSLDWNEMSSEDTRSFYWISRLFEEISPAVESKRDLAEFLKERQWPLIEHLLEQRKISGPVHVEEYPEFLVLLAQQVVDMSQFLPSPEADEELTPSLKARYFTAFLRSIGFQFEGKHNDITEVLREYSIAKLFKVKVDDQLGKHSGLSNKKRADMVASLSESSSAFQEIRKLYAGLLAFSGEELKDLTPKAIAREYLKKAPVENLSLNKREQKILEASLLPLPNILECSITRQHIEMPFKNKIEDNIPKVSLVLSKEAKKQLLTLAYDPYGTGLKWPALNGEYLFRFQPRFLEIPYHVRLRDTRQLNYASSMQAFSYESDIIITDKRNGKSVEATLSMNNVYETWDGYRFYMANITPPNEVAAQRAQIIVNHDPGKYWLTYPGGCILSLGIVLLFWLRPYRKRVLNFESFE